MEAAKLERDHRFEDPEHTAAEMAEGHLISLIERRYKQRVKKEGRDRPVEELYRESERRHYVALAEQRNYQCLAYHEGQARRLKATLASLVARHEEEAARYRRRLAASG